MSKAVFLALLIPCLFVVSVAGITVGSTHIDWHVTLQVLGAKVFPFWITSRSIDQADEVIIWLIRVPRVLVAGLVGAALAMAGAMMQGLFRNPLAEPNIVGVGAGAGLGAVLALLSGLTLKSVLVLPAGAFIGALAALVAVYAMATRAGTTRVSAFLLSGIALAALLGAVTSFLLLVNARNQRVAEEILFWMIGGLDGRTWTHVWISAPFILLALLVGLFYARDLDLLVQGEESAGTLGVEVERSKRVIITMSALMTGSAVAVAGAIGFVGLIVPHMVRLVVGPVHRVLLPSSALGGAAFLIGCDFLARTLRPPTEIRLGIITAAFGTPFFLLLLIRKYREVNL